LSDYAAGNYDYLVTYYVTNTTDGSQVPYAQSNGVITIPDDSSPITLTQTNIQLTQLDKLLSEDLGQYDYGYGAPYFHPSSFQVTGSGNTISWSYLMGEGADMTVQSRAVGSTTWTTQTVSVSGGYFTADLGPGPVEYQIDYNNGATQLG